MIIILGLIQLIRIKVKRMNEKTVRFIQYPDGTKGLIPRLNEVIRCSKIY